MKRILLIVASAAGLVLTACSGNYFNPLSGFTRDDYQKIVKPEGFNFFVGGDSFEPNNTYLSATAIVQEISQSHSMVAADVDCFSFNAIAGTRYTIATASSIDTKIELCKINQA